MRISGPGHGVLYENQEKALESRWGRQPSWKENLKDKRPENEFRAMVPLTTYEDYADVLLLARGHASINPLYGYNGPWDGKHPVVALHQRHAEDL